MGEEKKYIRQHGVQLAGMDIIELYFKAERRVSTDENIPDIKVLSGRTDYDNEKKEIHVAVKAEIGMDEDMSDPPFVLRVEIAGHFVVDEEKFNPKYIDHWAERNAPFILSPYLREQVYGLTIRAGIKPVLLPLLEVPLLKESE